MNDIVVELERLWKAGAADLPKAAAAYSTAAAAIHRTGIGESRVFSRPDGGMGDLYPEWSKLRNTLQDKVLGPSCENLVGAGDTLTHMADDFAELDGTSRGRLQDYKDGVDSWPADDQPPEHIPVPPKHTDAHPAETPLQTRGR